MGVARHPYVDRWWQTAKPLTSTYEPPKVTLDYGFFGSLQLSNGMGGFITFKCKPRQLFGPDFGTFCGTCVYLPCSTFQSVRS